jgi:hypothetical protein
LRSSSVIAVSSPSESESENEWYSVVALSEVLSFSASFTSLRDTRENTASSAEESSDGESENSGVVLVCGSSDDGSEGYRIDINLDDAWASGSEITKGSYSGGYM